jgi:antirestriction protein ArdC
MNVEQIITDRLIALLDAGTVPWRKTWKGGGVPVNAVSKKAYRGINYFLLSCSGFGDNRWLTYKQASALGGNVKKGEKGTPVIYWSLVEKEQGDVTKKAAFLRYYTVFNAEQCEGLKIETQACPQEFVPVEAARQLVESTQAIIKHGGASAFYSPIDDFIQMPNPDKFESADSYYHTLFHELAHWTGHASRLGREGVAQVARFGSATYSREELVAEMASAFVSAKVGITPDFDNSAAYLKEWIKVLKGDSKLALKAASAASKAVDFIMGGPDSDEEKAAA